MQHAFGAGSAIPSRAASATAAAFSIAAIAAGLIVATHHPIAPTLASCGFLLWFAAAVRWPSAWLFVLPASLPFASLAPWTGWIAFDEFDLIVIAAIAAGYARRVFAQAELGTNSFFDPKRRAPFLMATALAAVTAAVFIRGLLDAGSSNFTFYGGYETALNSVRAVKSVVYALALQPMLRTEWSRSRAGACRALGAGMLAGIVVVVAAACWERAAYPGIFDFFANYRTVALFWEMHVGGAAIDGYLAMAMPFVAWAVLWAPTRTRWAAAALLAIVAEYACMTTYSRGMYAAIGGGFIAYAIARRREVPRAARQPGWRKRANLSLVVVLIAEGCAMVGSGPYLLDRLEQSSLDFGSRMDHWRSGLALVESWPRWWLGIGLGRYPADYPGVPKDAEAMVGDAGPQLRLHGPRDAERAGLYALTQSLPSAPHGQDVAFEILAEHPVSVGVALCESHLIHQSGCARGTARADATEGRWKRVAVHLQSEGTPRSNGFARGSVFSMALLDVDAQAEVRNIVVETTGHRNALINGDFSRSLAHWFPVANNYFAPWHIDNLYLEALIEQGIAGLLILLALLAMAFSALATDEARRSALTPPLAGALTGVVLVGMVSNLLDVPRVAFLFYLLAFVAIESGNSEDARATSKATA